MNKQEYPPIPEPVNKKLLGYQTEHVDRLNYILAKGNGLDASDTGTGKTYTSIAAAICLKLKPFVICPKSVLKTWFEVLNIFKCPFYGVGNYESLQNCKWFQKSLTGGKSLCPFITREMVTVPAKEEKNTAPLDALNYQNPNEKYDSCVSKKQQAEIQKNDKNTPKVKKQRKYCTFKWDKLPTDALVIFDEAHRCKNRRTVNSVMLISLYKHLHDHPSKSRILLLSATVSDKPENFELAGLVLGCYANIQDANNWLEKVGVGFSNPMSGVHDFIYPDKASRMRIRDLQGLFPENQVIAQCYDMDTAEEIEKQYKLIEKEVERIKSHEFAAKCPLTVILYARMRIEQLKIPTLIDETKKFLAENASVAIFVNFTNTLETLKAELKTNCVIYGKQTLEERDHNIAEFNTDKSRIIICNSRSGGVGISLHDTIGVHARVSIISPSWSAQDIIQVLGRTYRARGKTPVRQRIIYCSGTVEEKICENMKSKINNIASLNDGDLLSYNIEGLTDKIKEKQPETAEEQKNHVSAQINVLKLRRIRLEEELREVREELENLDFIVKHF